MNKFIYSGNKLQMERLIATDNGSHHTAAMPEQSWYESWNIWLRKNKVSNSFFP